MLSDAIWNVSMLAWISAVVYSEIWGDRRSVEQVGVTQTGLRWRRRDCLRVSKRRVVPALRVCARPQADSSALLPVGGLIVFFSVFYANQCAAWG